MHHQLLWWRRRIEMTSGYVSTIKSWMMWQSMIQCPCQRLMIFSLKLGNRTCFQRLTCIEDTTQLEWLIEQKTILRCLLPCRELWFLQDGTKVTFPLCWLITNYLGTPRPYNDSSMLWRVRNCRRYYYYYYLWLLTFVPHLLHTAWWL